MSWLKRLRMLFVAAHHACATAGLWLVAFLLLVPNTVKASSAASTAQTAGAQNVRLEAHAGGATAYRLDNGFRIILIPYTNASDVRIELMVKAGAKLEDYGQSGLAHVLEHMMFLSAGQRENVGLELSSLVSDSNAVTDSDSTRYYASMVPNPETVDRVLRIKADQFLRPVFNEQELRREIQVVLNELDESADDAVAIMVAALERNSFAFHGYTRTVGGARSDVAKLTAQDLRAFHLKHYRPDNAVLIVSGRFDQKQVLELASELFGQAVNPPGAAPVNHTQEDKLGVHQTSKISLPTGKTRVASAWKLPGYAHRQSHVANVAIQGVCARKWGSLKRELVHRRKLALSASCFVIHRPDYSMLMAFADAPESVDPQKLSDALTRHLQGEAARGVLAASIERGRVDLRNEFEHSTQNHTEMAELLETAEAAGDWRLAFWVRDVEQSATVTEANEVLGRWLTSENRADVLVSHSDAVQEVSIPYETNALALVLDKTWPSVVAHGDPPPISLRALANATVRLDLDAQGSRASFISRRTQNDKVWLQFRNDYGNFSALKGRSTACELTDEVLRHGSASLENDQLQAKLAQLNVRYDIGLSGFDIEAPRQHLQEAFETLLRAWSSPVLTRPTFEIVKSRFIGSLRSDLEDPQALLRSAIAMRFDNFPVGHPDKPATLKDQIKNAQRVSFADVRRCVEDFAKLSRVRLAVVGNVGEQDVRRLWQSAQKTPRAKIQYRPIEVPPAPTFVDLTPIKQQHAAASSSTVYASSVIQISQRSPDYAALELAVFALNQKDSGRVWRRMRAELGLSYDAGVRIFSDEVSERTTIEFHATVSPDRTDEAEAALRELVDELSATGLTEEEITQAKQAWTTARVANLDVESNHAVRLAHGLLFGHGFDWLASHDEALMSKTVHDILRVFARYLPPTSFLRSRVNRISN